MIGVHGYSGSSMCSIQARRVSLIWKLPRLTVTTIQNIFRMNISTTLAIGIIVARGKPNGGNEEMEGAAEEEEVRDRRRRKRVWSVN